MADIDFLTALKNAVQQIGGVGQAWTYLGGGITSAAYSASVALTTKAGRVAYVSVIAGGSAAGYIYNCPTLAAVADSNKLMIIPMTTGVHAMPANFNNGLVIAPGAGQLISVTYSLAQAQPAAS